MIEGAEGENQSQIPDTITFTNTTTYGRILGTPMKEN